MDELHLVYQSVLPLFVFFTLQHFLHTFSSILYTSGEILTAANTIAGGCPSTHGQQPDYFQNWTLLRHHCLLTSATTNGWKEACIFMKNEKRCVSDISCAWMQLWILCRNTTCSTVSFHVTLIILLWEWYIHGIINSASCWVPRDMCLLCLRSVWGIHEPLRLLFHSECPI